MMEILANPFRGGAAPAAFLTAGEGPSADPAAVLRLLAHCPKAAATPLRAAPALAASAGIEALHLKDERARMGLGSFKALGAAYAIAREAEVARERSGAAWETALAGRVFVTASAGNHGLSVAAGARLFGARAVVYLAETVPAAFAARLEALGAEARRAGADYEASMAAAEDAAAAEGADLLSDSSWEGYAAPARRVMEGYLAMAVETAQALGAAGPSHIFLQAGVGGMAAAVAAYARRAWGDGPRIIVVEPAAAPALIDSVRAGRPLRAEGPVSAMGRLDCKEPSLLALAGLARDADLFMTITEPEAAAGVAALGAAELETTPSGGAGVAGLLAAAGDPAARATLGLGASSQALGFLTEGREG